MASRHKFKTLDTVTIKFVQGTLTDEAITEAFKLRKLLKCEVVFVFNKVELSVSEYKTHEELKKAFLHEMDTRKL